MTIFWILAAGLAGLAVLFVVAPLLQASFAQGSASPSDGVDGEADQARHNLALFKQQVAELDADLESGKLDQTLYESARRDLERQLLHDLGDSDPLTAVAGVSAGQRRYRLPGPRLTALALLIAVPLAAWALYGLIGNQAIIPQLERLAATGGNGAQHGGAGAELPPIEELIARLEQRLEQQPNDAEGWMMLGRTYFATGNRQGAEDALARAYDLTPNDPMIVLAYAESIATNNDNQLEGRPAELISEALELEPNNTTARWLAAMVAFQRGQFQSAATTWRNLLEQVGPESEDAAELRTLIDEAELRAGLPADAMRVAQQAADAQGDPISTESPRPSGDKPEQLNQVGGAEDAGAEDAAAKTSNSGEAPSEPPAAPPAAPPASAASDDTGSAASEDAVAGPGLRVQVALAPGLNGRLPPSTPVFIYAKAASGPPMPLAVQRATLADLPLEARLDDSMAMMPAMQLSNFPQVIVGARVSPSGQAMPRPGDLQGETGPVASDRAAPVGVEINRVIP
jgi:cytochrome c-type biogenesis protein CcmH